MSYQKPSNSYGKITGDDAKAFGFARVFLFIWIGCKLVRCGVISLTIFFYVVIYTIWLKVDSISLLVEQPVLFPPMIGWAVATSGISVEVFMFSLIFL